MPVSEAIKMLVENDVDNFSIEDYRNVQKDMYNDFAETDKCGFHEMIADFFFKEDKSKVKIVFDVIKNDD